jgi:hypothetical protein
MNNLAAEPELNTQTAVSCSRSDSRALPVLATHSQLWGLWLREVVTRALGVQIEARLGVADTRPQAFAE